MESIFNMSFANQKQRKLISAIALFLAIAIFLLALASGLYYSVYGLYKERKKNIRTPVEISTTKKSNGSSLQKTIQQNLFGKKRVVVAAPKPKPKPVQKKIEETKLDLALKGLLSASNQETARAIISVKKKPGKLYRVGDELEGAAGVKVEEIKPSGVLINRNGKLENLALVKKTSVGKNNIINFGNNEPAPTLPTARSANSTSRTAVNRSRPSSNTQRTSIGRRALKRPSASQFRGLEKKVLEEELKRTKR